MLATHEGDRDNLRRCRPPHLQHADAHHDAPRVQRAALRSQRDDLADAFEKHDQTLYYPIDSEKSESKYYPTGLPSARALPPIAEIFDHESKSYAPAQRKLSTVVHLGAWTAARQAAHDFDEHHPHPTTRNRDGVRFIGSSQWGAGSWLDITPDGSRRTKIDSPEFAVALQRRGGLFLAAMCPACDVLEARGEDVDRFGDKEANPGEYNLRHNATLRAVANMVRAVAIGPVILGDKEHPDRTAHLNTGYAVDIAELDPDQDTLYEIKVPSLLKQSFAAGRGSKKHGGCPASVGHLHGFGSTAEQLRVKVKGCRARGSERQGPFDHATGKGWVKERRGDYYDAIHVKKHRTLLFLVESSGGIGGDGQEQCVRLSKRARGHIGADRTTYGTLRTSPQTFLTHHIQQITKAAVFYDAKAILRSVDVRKAVAARPQDGAPPTQPRSRPAQHRPHPTRTLTRTRMAR